MPVIKSKYIFILASLILLSFQAAASAAAGRVQITTRETTLYNYPGAGWTDNRLTEGAVVDWLGEEKDRWRHVRMRNGEEGWVPDWLSRVVPASPKMPGAFDEKTLPTTNAPLYGRVIADRVTFRSIPYGGLNAKLDITRGGMLPKNCIVKIIDKINHWFQAQLGPTETGWIYDEALSPESAPAEGVRNGIPLIKLQRIDYKKDKSWPRIEFAFSGPVPYMVQSNLNPGAVAFEILGVDCSALRWWWNSDCLKAGGWCECLPGTDKIQGCIPAPAELAGFESDFEDGTFSLSLRDSRNAPIRTIVIDPGHGAPDPPPKGFAEGAHGPNNLMEKDAVMDISRRLAQILESRGFEVFLTRNGDTTEMMDLYRRVEFSEKAGADLFISVHANGDTNRDLKGAEVYWFEPQSRPLAELVAEEISKATGRDPGVALFGSFAVIRQTRPLAILVETGYMSNPAEGKRFADPEFLQGNAGGIAAGVERYIERLGRAAR